MQVVIPSWGAGEREREHTEGFFHRGHNTEILSINTDTVHISTMRSLKRCFQVNTGKGKILKPHQNTVHCIHPYTKHLSVDIAQAN